MKKKFVLSAKEIALIGMMVAVIEACKFALMGLPNIELTTFWVIMFTLFFGKRILFVIPVFILVEGSMFGIHTWWIMYFYMWPALAFVTHLCRKNDSALFWSLLSAAFGFLFGFFCAIPYVVMGWAGGGLINGFYAGFVWWVAGIPWDIVHGIGNFVLMFILYKPIQSVMKKVKTGIFT